MVDDHFAVTSVRRTAEMAFEEELSRAVQQVVRRAVEVGGNDLEFHGSLDGSLASSLDRTSEELLGLASRLLGFVARDKGDGDPIFEDFDDVDARWGRMTDVVDHLLEQADHALDELRRKPQAAPAIAVAAAAASTPGSAVSQSGKKDLPPLPAHLRNCPMEPPQKRFRRRLSNTDDTWAPFLTNKVNARQPLAESLAASRDVALRRPGHPYCYEIMHCEYPPRMYREGEAVPFAPMADGEATWVDTVAEMQAMLGELRQAREIAIDLEHHDFHCYRGITSLMQVSTRHQDWVVDTIALRDELIVLNGVFTDPHITKVLHGASSDIVWLQRDLGLYVVNLFDTYQASKALGFESRSLAFLLEKYAGFEADKRYQLADWRIRPLPAEMLFYARSDTHFLLYVYDRVRAELLQASKPGTHSLIDQVLRGSEETALRQYVPEAYDDVRGRDGVQGIIDRNLQAKAFVPSQTRVLRAVHKWRDDRARQDDESTRFVMGNNQLISVAATAPKTTAELQQACKPMSSTVQQHQADLLRVVAEAVASNEPPPELQLASRASAGQQVVSEAAVPAAAAAVSAKASGTSAPAGRLTTSTAFTAPTIVGGVTGDDISALRAHDSAFWGTPSVSSALVAAAARDGSRALQLTVALPPLAAKIYADPADEIGSEVSDAGSSAAEADAADGDADAGDDDDDDALAVDQLQRDSATADTARAGTDPSSDAAAARQIGKDVFTIRDLQRQSKRRAPASTIDQNAGDAEAEPGSAKKRKREAKKAARAAATDSALLDNAGSLDLDGNGAGADEEDSAGASAAAVKAPFDYTTAPRVLQQSDPASHRAITGLSTQDRSRKDADRMRAAPRSAAAGRARNAPGDANGQGTTSSKAADGALESQSATAAAVAAGVQKSAKTAKENKVEAYTPKNRIVRTARATAGKQQSFVAKKR